MSFIVRSYRVESAASSATTAGSWRERFTTECFRAPWRDSAIYCHGNEHDKLVGDLEREWNRGRKCGTRNNFLRRTLYCAASAASTSECDGTGDESSGCDCERGGDCDDHECSSCERGSCADDGGRIAGGTAAIHRDGQQFNEHGCELERQWNRRWECGAGNNFFERAFHFAADFAAGLNSDDTSG